MWRTKRTTARTVATGELRHPNKMRLRAQPAHGKLSGMVNQVRTKAQKQHRTRRNEYARNKPEETPATHDKGTTGGSRENNRRLARTLRQTTCGQSESQEEKGTPQLHSSIGGRAQETPSQPFWSQCVVNWCPGASVRAGEQSSKPRHRNSEGAPKSTTAHSTNTHGSRRAPQKRIRPIAKPRENPSP